MVVQWLKSFPALKWHGSWDPGCQERHQPPAILAEGGGRLGRVIVCCWVPAWDSNLTSIRNRGAKEPRLHSTWRDTTQGAQWTAQARERPCPAPSLLSTEGTTCWVPTAALMLVLTRFPGPRPPRPHLPSLLWPRLSGLTLSPANCPSVSREELGPSCSACVARG